MRAPRESVRPGVGALLSFEKEQTWVPESFLKYFEVRDWEIITVEGQKIDRVKLHCSMRRICLRPETDRRKCIAQIVRGARAA